MPFAVYPPLWCENWQEGDLLQCDLKRLRDLDQEESLDFIDDLKNIVGHFCYVNDEFGNQIVIQVKGIVFI